MAPRLSALLVQDRVVSFRQMDAAVQRQRQHGGRIGTILLELGFVEEPVLCDYLARQRGIAAASLDELASAQPDALARIPREQAVAWGCLPLRTHDGNLVVAVLEPIDPELRQRVESELGCALDERLALEFRYWQAFEAWHGFPIPVRYHELSARFPFPGVSAPRPAPRRTSTLRRITVPLPSLDPPERASGAPAAPPSAEAAFGLAPPPVDAPPPPVDAPPPAEPSPPEPPRPAAPARRLSARIPAPASTAPRAADGPTPLETLLSRFESASDRDELLHAALDYAVVHVPRAWLLVASRDTLRGFAARGSRAAEDAVCEVRLPRPASGPLSEALEQDAFVQGTPEWLELEGLYAQAGVVAPPELAVVPVEIAGRVSLLLAVDAVAERLPARILPQLLIVVHSLGVALTRLVRARRSERSGEHSGAQPAAPSAVPAPVEPAPVEAAPVEAGADADPPSVARPEAVEPAVEPLPDEASDSGQDPIPPPDELGDWLADPAPQLPFETGEEAPDVFDISMLPVDDDEAAWDDVDASIEGAREEDWSLSRLPDLEGERASRTEAQAASAVTTEAGPRPMTVPLPVQGASPEPPTGKFGVVADAEEPPERALPQVTQQNRALGEGAPRSPATLTLDAALVGHLLEKADDDGEWDDSDVPSLDVDDALVDDPGPDLVIPNIPYTRPLDAVPGRPPGGRASHETQALEVVEAAEPSSDGGDPQPASDPRDTTRAAPLSWDVPDDAGGPRRPRPSMQTPVALDLAMPGVLQPTAEPAPPTARERTLQGIVARASAVDLVGLLSSDEQLLRDLAFAELLERGEAAWSALLQNFPGPLSYSRADAVRPTDPMESHGPVVWLCALQLRALAPYLTAFVDSSDEHARYYAVQLLLRLGDPAYLDVMAVALFDRDDEIRAAASDFAEALRAHSRHAALRGVIRRRIEEGDSWTVGVAAGHAAQFRDRLAVPLLVEALERHDETARRRIAEALRVLTFRDHGNVVRSWRKLLDRLGRTDRRAWLLSAMVDLDRGVREAVHEELQRIPQLVVNYHPDMDRRALEVARRAVETFLDRSQRSPNVMAWVNA